MVAIDNIPVTKDQRGKPKRYFFNALEKHEDSFFEPVRSYEDTYVLRANIIACFAQYKRTYKPSFKITTRKTTENGVEGIRVWRIDI